VDWQIATGRTDLGSKVIRHTTSRIEVADVDHGSDTATPAAAQSASWPASLRSNTFAIKRFIHISLRLFEATMGKIVDGSNQPMQAGTLPPLNAGTYRTRTWTRVGQRSKPVTSSAYRRGWRSSSARSNSLQAQSVKSTTRSASRITSRLSRRCRIAAFRSSGNTVRHWRALPGNFPPGSSIRTRMRPRAAAESSWRRLALPPVPCMH
jgi:hypothetical protein